jgi:hypothetical protein
MDVAKGGGSLLHTDLVVIRDWVDGVATLPGVVIDQTLAVATSVAPSPLPSSPSEIQGEMMHMLGAVAATWFGPGDLVIRFVFLRTLSSTFLGLLPALNLYVVLSTYMYSFSCLSQNHAYAFVLHIFPFAQ